MGSRVRQFRQQLGLASATALCALLSGAVSGSTTTSAIATTEPPPQFVIARLMYNDSAMFGGFGRGFGGRCGGSWCTDAPEAEYHLTQGIRRLTRINTLDPETQFQLYAIQPDDPRLFDYPFLYGVEVGRWYLDDHEAQNLRDYLLRGGFLMVDDFHGSAQWEGFMESMRRVFPDRDVEVIPDAHEVFHVLYDLDQKIQIPGIVALRSGVTYEQDGYTPQWLGVFDDNRRLMVAINFNMDLGDAWELADDPDYPQPMTALAYRFAISYALYAMTH